MLSFENILTVLSVNDYKTLFILFFMFLFSSFFNLNNLKRHVNPLFGRMSLKDGAKRAFYKEFRKVVEQADVVLQVLDARDPEGCRCKDVCSKRKWSMTRSYLTHF